MIIKVQQVLVNIVEYMAGIWKGLLRPSKDFAMGEPGMLERYWEGLEAEQDGGKMDEDVRQAARSSWASLLSPSSSEPRMSLLTDEFMRELNVVKLGPTMKVKQVGRRKEMQYVDSVFTDSTTNVWNEYEEMTTEVMGRHILDVAFEETSDREVRDLWKVKWDFVTTDPRAVHYQRCLPLLTPSSLVVLAQALGRIEGAISEVSQRYNDSDGDRRSILVEWRTCGGRESDVAVGRRVGWMSAVRYFSTGGRQVVNEDYHCDMMAHWMWVILIVPCFIGLLVDRPFWPILQSEFKECV